MPLFIAGIVVNFFESRKAPLFIASLVLAIGLLGIYVSKAPPKPLEFADVLPEEFSPSVPLDGTPWVWRKGDPTIKDKLIELGAYIRDRKIVDRNGKEVVFLRIIGPGNRGSRPHIEAVWGGNIRRESLLKTDWRDTNKEIQELKKKYTVIITGYATK